MKFNKYISYFQKVTTIGVVTCAKSYDEAERIAQAEFKSVDPTKCFYDETEYELSDTEKLDPLVEIISEDPSQDGCSVEWQVNINNDMKEKIAKSMDKSPYDLTPEDCSQFMMQALEYGINNKHISE